MAKETVKAFFSFTRRERTGVIVLVILIILAFIWPYCLPSVSEGPDKALVAQFNKQLADRSDSASGLTGDERFPVEKDLYGKRKRRFVGRKEEYAEKDGTDDKISLFSFDPNTLSAAGWRKLGVKDRMISIILHYIARGGKFRKAEDLKKLYGLPEDVYERLAPYVSISPPIVKDSIERMAKWAVKGGKDDKVDKDDKRSFTISAIDINTADSAAWEALPGIGVRLAQRILHFKERLGGFYAVDQLTDVYGLPDSVFRRIQPFLQCGSYALRKININSADAKELKQHPYMSWSMANAIVQYRQQHGSFKTVNDLLQIAIADAGILKKVLPYLEVE